MTTAIYEIMSKLVPDIMEMGMFLCVQITGKLFKFLNNSFGSKADLRKFIIMIMIIIITMN